jgi:predicted DNA-binding antitoxin AbrB/MazE fold protein
MVIQAIFENGVFRPSEPVQLPESCRVELILRQTAVIDSPLTEKPPLAKLAEIAASHPENPNAPADLAAQHDHYLYGTPKR